MNPAQQLQIMQMMASFISSPNIPEEIKTDAKFILEKHMAILKKSTEVFSAEMSGITLER